MGHLSFGGFLNLGVGSENARASGDVKVAAAHGCAVLEAKCGKGIFMNVKVGAVVS